MPNSIPAEELPILENLLNIRAKLSVVKRNRSSYIHTEEIEPFRFEIGEAIRSLTELRGGKLLDESKELNRTDDVLDEILQMLSLCFLSLGKKSESTSVYSLVVTIKNIFDRLEEFGVYEEEYLKPYKTKLDEIEKILDRDTGNENLPEPIIQLLKYKHMQCTRIYNNLIHTIRTVDPELIPIRDNLLRIRRHIGNLCCRNYSLNDIKSIQEKIRTIDQTRIEGKFIYSDETPGQTVLTHLFESLYRWSQDLNLSPSLEPIRSRLFEIKRELERLELTHKWTLRQTDLFSYQHQLHDIVKIRTDGSFRDETGQVLEGQAVLDFLLRKCYRMIFVLLSESAPVSEALTPIYNQLTTVRQCLIAVKETGAPCSPEELYPYQMKLMSIENLRKDGKFYDDQGFIPEGQGLLVDLVEECYILLEELRDEAVDDDSS